MDFPTSLKNSLHVACKKITLKPQREVTSFQLEDFYQEDEGKSPDEAVEKGEHFHTVGVDLVRPWWKTTEKGLENENESYSMLPNSTLGFTSNRHSMPRDAFCFSRC